MGWIRILTLGVGLVFLIRSVNSSATCVEKFLDGETAETKHEVTVGERVTLRCDVTARNATRDMVYWKFDDEVMSQDDKVIDKYKSKFNVTLEPKIETLSGKDVYTISWIVELDDAGKYNCTCTTGGIQYQVWIKRPCNEPKHVLKTTDASTKPNCTTSPEVLDFLLTKKCYALEVGESYSLNLSIALDCNCTWPEVNRNFTGVWYAKTTDDQCKEDERVEVVLANVTGKQDTSITPIGCYTGKGAVTYRYRNVFGCIKGVFTCTPEMAGKEYYLYIDEGQSTRPVTLMKICCSGPCQPPLPPTSQPPVCRRNFEISIIVIGIITGILTVAAIATRFGVRSKKQDDIEKTKKTKKDCFTTYIIVATIILLVVAIIMPVTSTQLCPPIDQLYLPTGVITGIVVVSIFAIAVIIFSGLSVYSCDKLAAKTGKKKEAKNPRLSAVSQISNSSTLPLEQGQIMASTTPYPGNPNLTNGGIKGIFNPAYVNNRSAYKEVSPSQTQPKEKDIANENIPLSVQQPKVKLCMNCSKSPVQVYFKPCRHAACTSCAMSILDKSSQPSWPALCPECKESVSGYQNICKVCSENPVIGYLTPCNHEVVCKVCAFEMMKKSIAYCPACRIEVYDYNF